MHTGGARHLVHGKSYTRHKWCHHLTECTYRPASAKLMAGRDVAFGKAEEYMNTEQTMEHTGPRMAGPPSSLLLLVDNACKFNLYFILTSRPFLWLLRCTLHRPHLLISLCSHFSLPSLAGLQFLTVEQKPNK